MASRPAGRWHSRPPRVSAAKLTDWRCTRSRTTRLSRVWRHGTCTAPLSPSAWRTDAAALRWGRLWSLSGSDAVAAAIPHARRLTLEGQHNEVDANVLAPVLLSFFAERT